MTEVRISIKPAIFDWVIQNVNIDELKTKFKEEFLLWMSGEKAPTFNQLEQFSKTTNIPFGYFFLDTPPIEQMGLLEYRTIDSINLKQPSRNLVDTIHEMEDVQEWMRDYIRNADLGDLTYVGKYKNIDDVAQIADGIRSELGLDKKWFHESSGSWDSFKLIRERLEKIGTLVMMSGIVGSNTHRSLDINEFRAFTLIDKYAPLIFINANDSSNGRLFSLVHEMTHIWLGEDSFYNDYQNHVNDISKIEILCNAVTAEILVPIDLFNSSWYKSNINDINEKINDIATYFKCGTTVIARRALDRGFIDKNIYYAIAETAINKYKEQKNNQGSGGNYYNTLKTRVDNRLVHALSNSIYEGKTAFTEAYRLTHTNRKTFSELVRMVAGAAL